MLLVGANTPHVKAPPVVKPRAPPMVDMVATAEVITLDQGGDNASDNSHNYQSACFSHPPPVINGGPGTKVGVLDCRLAPSVGLIVVEFQNMECRFTPDMGGPFEVYEGSITRRKIAPGRIRGVIFDKVL
jgi:Protein of unknown function (DUF992)